MRSESQSNTVPSLITKSPFPLPFSSPTRARLPPSAGETDSVQIISAALQAPRHPSRGIRAIGYPGKRRGL